MNPTDQIAKVMHYKELHLSLLRIMHQFQRPLTPKQLIELFAINYLDTYAPDFKGYKYTITNAKIYAALKLLEKDQLIQRVEPHDPSLTENPSVKRQPEYVITEEGKQLVSASLSINIQNILGFFVAIFIREKQTLLFKFSKHAPISIGIFGPRNPLGQTVLAFLLQSPLLDELLNIRTVYFVDFDRLLTTMDPSSSEPSSYPPTPLLSDHPRVKFRSCSLLNNRLSVDIGNNQLDLVISLMGLSNFTEFRDSLTAEVYRMLKPGGLALFQELNLSNSIILWLLQKLNADEAQLMPFLLSNLLRLGHVDPTTSYNEMIEVVKQYFGDHILVDHLDEVFIISARKS